METLHIDTTRDHRYVGRVDIVVPHHVPLAGRALSHQGVASSQYPALYLKPATGFLFPWKLGRGVLRITKRVRHVHNGNIKGRTKPHAYPAGKPVVTVDEVVLQLLVSDEVQHPVRELRQVVPDTVLAVRRRRARRHMNDASSICEVDNSGVARILTACVHVHGNAQIA